MKSMVTFWVEPGLDVGSSINYFQAPSFQKTALSANSDECLTDLTGTHPHFKQQI